MTASNVGAIVLGIESSCDETGAGLVRITDGAPELLGHPDQQRTGQSRAARHRDGVDVAVADAGIVEGGADGGRHRLQVRAGGNFRHHSPEPGVFVLAGRERVAEQFRRTVGDPHQTGPGLVAGRFDTCLLYTSDAADEL